MAGVIETTEENFKDQVLQSETICCVYYNARWCKAGADLMETVKAASDVVADKMRFCEVDTDKQEHIIQAQQVRTIPSFQFIKDGRTVDQLRGAVSKLDLLGKISAVLTEHGGSDPGDQDAADSPSDTPESEAPPDETPAGAEPAAS